MWFTWEVSFDCFLYWRILKKRRCCCIISYFDNLFTSFPYWKNFDNLYMMVLVRYNQIALKKTFFLRSGVVMDKLEKGYINVVTGSATRRRLILSDWKILLSLLLISIYNKHMYGLYGQRYKCIQNFVNWWKYLTFYLI